MKSTSRHYGTRYQCHAVFLTIVIAAQAQNPKLETKQPLAIFFDGGGVLFEQKKGTLTTSIGLHHIMRYAIRSQQGPSKELQKNLYKLLTATETGTNDNGMCDPQGNLLPGIMCDWLTGKKSASQIREIVRLTLRSKKTIFNSKAERIVLGSISNVIFSPHEFARVHKPTKKSRKWVTACKAAGHHVYILSNWDPESFEIMQSREPAFFNLFDGIIISGKAGYAKPSTKIFELARSKVPTTMPCVLLDDQKENVEGATKAGWHAFQWCPYEPFPDLSKL